MIYDLIYKRIHNKQLDDATPHNRSAVFPDDAPSERLRHLAAQHKQRRCEDGPAAVACWPARSSRTSPAGPPTNDTAKAKQTSLTRTGSS
ncbi:hypothetical protein GTA08_BOTSDO07266 [Botryosphaeria dothidea]|uniref:Uncharacterized protein n=1 Tax=Botryosphaeria dothidea TaxID=55169 RepID=A0A8H4N2I2_9PEZI|nr:hypothetical protein GTA08_BOTSDO11457 [Botryosphaeria dothidea]KAF4305182.1 hypothetical protein GTA08_BOTSDO07266 [Botryosphaeria dothidea]